MSDNNTQVLVATACVIGIVAIRIFNSHKDLKKSYQAYKGIAAENERSRQEFKDRFGEDEYNKHFGNK